MQPKIRKYLRSAFHLANKLILLYMEEGNNKIKVHLQFSTSQYEIKHQELYKNCIEKAILAQSMIIVFDRKYEVQVTAIYRVFQKLCDELARGLKSTNSDSHSISGSKMSSFSPIELEYTKFSQKRAFGNESLMRLWQIMINHEFFNEQLVNC